ncbi:MAG: electron transfer flavoprotein subunit beta/FixA family protein [Lachnospiraceae bacterium]
MMRRILGCFSVVPDLELLSEEDWIADENNLVDTSFVKSTWNVFDESALELMLRLSGQSESLKGSISMDAVTIGEKLSERYLKTLHALGIDQAVRIECQESIQFSPELVSGLLTEYIRHKGKQDIIVMGTKTADGSSGKVPQLTAEKLGYPCITQVIAIEPVKHDNIKVTSIVDAGLCIQTICPPCVLAVGDAPGTSLSVPTLKARMNTKAKPVLLYPAEQLLSGNLNDIQKETVLIELTAVDEKRGGKLLCDGSLEEQMEILYQSFLKDRV